MMPVSFFRMFCKYVTRWSAWNEGLLNTPKVTYLSMHISAMIELYNCNLSSIAIFEWHMAVDEPRVRRLRKSSFFKRLHAGTSRKAKSAKNITHIETKKLPYVYKCVICRRFVFVPLCLNGVVL